MATGSETGTVKRGRGRPKGSKDKKKRSYTVSEKAIAQRRAVSPITQTAIQQKTPGDIEENARLIEHIMRINEIAVNADRNDLLSLKSCFVAYLKLCQEDGFKVGNLAAYAAMGFDNYSFNHFSKRDNPEIKEFCKFVRKTCAIYREMNVSEGKLNPVIGIFWQRNFDGLRNDTEQVQAINEQQDDYTASKGYKEKYKNLIGD